MLEYKYDKNFLKNFTTHKKYLILINICINNFEKCNLYNGLVDQTIKIFIITFNNKFVIFYNKFKTHFNIINIYSNIFLIFFPF